MLVANVFDKYGVRKNSSTVYFKGVIESSNGKGVALRKWSTVNQTFGADLQDGAVVYVFETSAYGWARIYSSTNDAQYIMTRLELQKSINTI